MFGKKSARLKPILIALSPVVCFLFSMSIGHYEISAYEVLDMLFSKLTASEMRYGDMMQTVVFEVRLPRVILAMMVGCSLSVSGAVYQCVFKNPMASPNILGTSSGAGLGTALAIIFSFGAIYTQMISFAFGLLAVAITYAISAKIGRRGNLILVFVLTGILVSTVFQALISLVKYTADPYEKLPAITFWLMGSLSTAGKNDILIILIPFLLGIVPLFLMRWRLNILSLGDDDVKCLGIDVRNLRLIVIGCSTLLTASCVSVAGIIGWVGLIVPHIARMLVGSNFIALLPSSALIGATYLLLIDDAARGIFKAEIPLSILTALIGAPYFIYLLVKTKDAT
ncbi:iron chelate uptake ABC transporter, FeCT family, permease protein [Campylobacter rectus RM3267]|uniref:Iron ABC transporter, permease protein n=2 Tax=Campylobacter rectus TaxID=203 RepID=A0A6G5QJH2_CAMRE|nr:iron ABC transporter permease [Campylobacter rectus]EEF15338.1 iron chelate uptake ABC transporter, FeCT family, permease protein [Campylobacter rectus RM3267]QCD45863.1 iron ABC transporter, permease protein [Campylobacter rectus]UEB48842.1 iron ABC transporter permease [Campylobacter rectus]